MSWGNAWGTRTWGGGTLAGAVVISTGPTANAVHLRMHVVTAATVTVGKSYILTPGFIPIA